MKGKIDYVTIDDLAKFKEGETPVNTEKNMYARILNYGE